MPNDSGRNTELTPEAIEVVKDIATETLKLRAIDLAEIPPATVFHAE
jgi:hypothetical protein